MTAPSPRDDTHKAMFMDLVAMLSATTMQQMGKIINPLSGKTELNLDAAQATIDLLEAIEAKTQGNLDREEDRFLKNTLTTLRMNFVETRAKPAPPPASSPPSPTTADGATKEPRFHKSYG